jgi:hypothetical protein
MEAILSQNVCGGMHKSVNFFLDILFRGAQNDHLPIVGRTLPQTFGLSFAQC